MIKKNEYYVTVYGRNDKLKQRLLAVFFGISSYPRLLIEVFLRRDMGRNYFSLSYCILCSVVLFLLPFLLASKHGYEWYDTFLQNWGWYLFLIAFCKFSLNRNKESKFPYGYFDFNHFSKSAGKRLPQVDRFEFRGKLVNERFLDVYLEPLLATAVGLLAFLVGQWMIGLLLVICGGIYSLSYKAAYMMGRDFILRKIDENIANVHQTTTFLNDQPDTSNFNYFGSKPSSEAVRRGLAELLRDDDDGSEVA